MKSKKLTQIELIVEKDPRKFQKKVNDSLAERDTILDVNTKSDSSGYTALITYEEVKEEPEDAADKYYLDHGRHYVCSDCPSLVPDADARSTTHYCKHHEDRVRMKQPACNWFYEGLDCDTLHVVTPEERKKSIADAIQEVIDLREKKKKVQNEITRITSKRERELKTWYSIEWIGLSCPEEYKRIENRDLHLSEFNMLAPTIRKTITQSDLIKIARKAGADALWKTGLDGMTDNLLERK